MMNAARLLIASGFASALLLSAGTTQAASDFSVQLNVGPPPVVYEAVPPPRVGYVWSQGYWDYDHNKHVWRKGHWEREQHGQRWAQGQWSERDGHWYLNRPHWER